jgi:hypothetical protein
VGHFNLRIAETHRRRGGFADPAYAIVAISVTNDFLCS